MSLGRAALSAAWTRVAQNDGGRRAILVVTDVAEGLRVIIGSHGRLLGEINANDFGSTT
jgi:hypothetical protein